MNLAVATPQHGAEEDTVTTGLMGAVQPEFLQLLSWDPHVRVLVLPRSHSQFSGEDCLVAGCDKMSYFARQKGMCTGCTERWKKSDLPFDEFVTTRRTGRMVGFFPCQVAHCERPGRRASLLCSSHDYQRRNVYGLPLEDFLAHPEVQPLPTLGPCHVAACDRQGESRDGYCAPHADQCRDLRQEGVLEDEDLWRLTTPAIAESRRVSLRGLPDRVVAEIIYGLRNGLPRDSGTRTTCCAICPTTPVLGKSLHSTNSTWTVSPAPTGPWPGASSSTFAASD